MEQTTRAQSQSAKAGSVSRSLYHFGKRLFDIAGAAVLLVVLSPFMLVVALATLIDSGVPIIYQSRRLGRYGQPITVLKFRTMRDGSHHHLAELLTASEERRLEYEVSRKLRDDPRKTRVGAFLRRTSLDELPQLWNVLKGEMSLIGPRPYFADELLGRPEADELLSVRPGITGLWQVNGRSDKSFKDRLRLELMYVRQRGVVLDFKIFVFTFRAVVSRRGAY